MGFKSTNSYVAILRGEIGVSAKILQNPPTSPNHRPSICDPSAYNNKDVLNNLMLLRPFFNAESNGAVDSSRYSMPVDISAVTKSRGYCAELPQHHDVSPQTSSNSEHITLILHKHLLTVIGDSGASIT